MTTNASMPCLVLLAAASFFAAPAALAAQRSVCVNGAPKDECSSFLILEAGGLLPVAQSTRGVTWAPNDGPVEQTAFGDRLRWEVGMMKNVNGRWAVGAAANLGSGSGGALTGLTARGRRWLSPDLGLDVSAGASFQQRSSGARRADPTADVRLNFRDDLHVGVRWEQIVLDPFRGVDSAGQVYFDDPGGRQHALSLILGVGSEWAIGGSAALGAALLAWLATADFS